MYIISSWFSLSLFSGNFAHLSKSLVLSVRGKDQADR